MAWIGIQDSAMSKLKRLAFLSRMTRAQVFCALADLWHGTQTEFIVETTKEEILFFSLSSSDETFSVDQKEKFFDALIQLNFITPIDDALYKINGNCDHISRIRSAKLKSAKGHDAKRQKKLSTKPTETKQDLLDKTLPGAMPEALPEALPNIYPETYFDAFSPQNSKTKQDLLDKTLPGAMPEALPDTDTDTDSFISSSSSLNFNKKEKEEKLIEASTNFVYEEKASAIDENFDEARYRYMKKFESIVDFEIRPSQMDKLRYSQLIKSGITPSQVLTMIDNYADYKLPQCKPGHYPIHRKFETFLGSPGNWICKEYLNPVMDKVKARQMAKEKAEDEKYHRDIAEGTAWREANRKAIESGNKNATAEDFLKPSDILNKMNLHLKL